MVNSYYNFPSVIGRYKKIAKEFKIDFPEIVGYKDNYKGKIKGTEFKDWEKKFKEKILKNKDAIHKAKIDSISRRFYSRLIETRKIQVIKDAKLNDELNEFIDLVLEAKKTCSMSNYKKFYFENYGFENYYSKIEENISNLYPLIEIQTLLENPSIAIDYIKMVDYIKKEKIEL